MFKLAVLILLAYPALGNAGEMLQLPGDIAGAAAESVLKCITETGVPPDVVQNVLSWTIKDQDVDATKKFVFCFLYDGGYLTDDAKLEMDKVLKLVESHKLKNEFKTELEACDKLTGSDKYDTTYKKAECYVKNSPLIFSI